MANTKPTAQTGALTLVLLVKKYRSQMIALLLKNGVVVSNNTSDQQVATLMANLLKVSKSYFTDLNNFIMNPTVTQVIVGEIGNTAQYLKMSGNGYMNVGGTDDPTDSSSDNSTANYDVPIDTNSSNLNDMEQTLNNSSTTDPTLVNAPIANNTKSGSTTPAPSSSLWTGFKSNLGNYLSQAIGLVGTLSTNNSNVAIANAHSNAIQAQANSAGAGINSGKGTGVGAGAGKGTPMSMTTKFIIGLVSVSAIGAIVYFVMKPKK